MPNGDIKPTNRRYNKIGTTARKAVNAAKTNMSKGGGGGTSKKPYMKKPTNVATTTKKATNTAMTTTKKVVSKIKSNMSKPYMSGTSMSSAMNKAADLTGMSLPTSVKKLKSMKTGATSSSVKARANKAVKNWKSKNGYMKKKNVSK